MRVSPDTDKDKGETHMPVQRTDIEDRKFEAGKLLEKARKAIDDGTDKDGNVSDEARNQAKGFQAEYAKKKEDIDLLQTQLEAEEAAKGWKDSAQKRQEELEAEIASNKAKLVATGGGTPEEAAKQKAMSEYASTMAKYSRHSPEDQKIISVSAHPEYASVFRRFMFGEIDAKEARKEMASLQKDINTSGGYLVLPMIMSNELIQAKTDIVKLRQLCSVERLVQAHKLGKPRLRTRMSAATMGSELTVAAEDTALDFGMREFEPHPASAFIKISEDLLRYSTFGPETIVKNELARVESELEENKFMSGNGVLEPLGLFTSSTDGIDSSRDVSTGANTTGPTLDHHKRVKFALREQYRLNARWLMHPDYILDLSLAKDGEGRYQWAESTKAGEPDMYHGHPVTESRFAPNAKTTGTYNAIFGDFKFYRIIDTDLNQLKQLNELFAMSNQVGFINRFEFDGAPMIAEAFVRAKNA